MILLHNYQIDTILIEMLSNPKISRQEIIDFVLDAGLVPQEKVLDFLTEYRNKYPVDWDAELVSDPIDPLEEGIVPLDWNDN